MSLLSDTNHTPQRVFALLRLLDALGGQLEFETIKTWFKPTTFRDTGQREPEDDKHSNIRQMIGAAASLGLVEPAGNNSYRLSVEVPDSLEAFADLVHDRLASAGNDHPDSIVLEAFAAVLAVTESVQNTSWLDESARDKAAKIQEAVHRDNNSDDETGLRFNSTKIAPWKRWIIFLGLGISMPKGDLYPYPAPRLARELGRARIGASFPESLAMDRFMDLVAMRMPYLDGGRLFRSAAENIRLPPLERKLTRVLSGSLRDLHDDKQLALETIGDAKQSYSLGP